MMKKRLLHRWNLIAVSGLFVVLMVAALLITSANPGGTPPSVSESYDYYVSSNEVKNHSGSVVHTANDFTSALKWATSQTGKKVYVPAGEYDVDSVISINVSSVTLIGDGPERTIFNFTSHDFVDYPAMPNAGFQALDANNIQFKQFGIIGAGGIEIRATSGTHKGYLVQDVKVENTSATLYHAFGVVVAAGATVENPQFVRCTAFNVAGDGFDLWGYGSSDIRQSGGWIRNAYFEDCKALYSGYTYRIWDWAVGFDLSEGCNTNNTDLVDCEASYNWESGFHFEGDGYTLNAVLSNCVANYNGQKYSDPRGAVWGKGYIFSAPQPASSDYPFGFGSQVTLKNCNGIGNTDDTTAYDKPRYVYTTTSYNYTVSGSTVLDSSGSTAHSDSDFTSALQWAVEQSNAAVYVPEGTYEVTKTIRVASGVTLYGADSLYERGNSGKLTVFQFPDNSDPGFLMQNVNNTHLFNFQVNHGSIEWKASEGVTMSGNEAKGVDVFQTSSDQPFAVGATGDGGSTIDGLELGAINVRESHTDGFGFRSSNDTSIIKNLDLTICSAEGSGLQEPRNNDSVGYRLGERNEIQNAILLCCESNSSWNSGFYFSGESNMASVTLQGCISNNNGQKGDASNGMGYQLDEQNNVRLISCTGSGNAGPLS